MTNCYSGKKKGFGFIRNLCVNVNRMSNWNHKASSISVGNSSCLVLWEDNECKGKFACIAEGSLGANGLEAVNMDNDVTAFHSC
jgi:hypothetical protein